MACLLYFLQDKACWGYHTRKSCSFYSNGTTHRYVCHVIDKSYIQNRTIRTLALWALGEIDPQQSYWATILDKNVKKMDIAISSFKIKSLKHWQFEILPPNNAEVQLDWFCLQPGGVGGEGSLWHQICRMGILSDKKHWIWVGKVHCHSNDRPLSNKHPTSNAFFLQFVSLSHKHPPSNKHVYTN